MYELDVRLFHAINGGPDWASPLFVFLSEATKAWSVRLVLVALAILLIVLGGKARQGVLRALVAWPVADGITHWLKLAVAWPRPCVELNDVVLRVGKLTSFGTASAHAANTAAVATVFVIALGFKKAWPVAALAFLTGFSRIYVGVHYPLQVLLGWTIGVAVGLVVTWAWGQAARLLRREPQPSG
ncbi:MAG: phosphatase PAP2 family protein [Fimbriimonas ginsengisoli]|uniref:Phosphatase PAP2 family protein n=1 Tax=Fimbriimonas ginsengisoli TaxID=1005039 RepID=A0A931LVJ6_FIMGI|nr:phosphatase PAP2 family protein [Fimbriimonas ginsengisoli]